MKTFSLILTVCMLPAVSLAENWPQWRGPNGNSVSNETGIPVEWSKTKNVAWRLELPGSAGATPVVWEDQIFLTSAEGDDLVLMSVSTSGKELWKKKVATGNQDARSGEGNSASASPTTDGKHVWCFFGTGDLACYTVDGEEVWAYNVQEKYGRFSIQFGMTSTPILYKGDLYLQLIHGEMREDYTVGKVIKLDSKTGKEIWAVDRPSNATFECKHSYASPFVYDDGKQSFLVTHGADFTGGYSLEDGTELWRFEGLNGPSKYNPGKLDPTFRFVSSPGVVDGSIIIPTAKRGPTIALKVSDALSGNATEKEQVVRWAMDKTPDVSIPIVHEGLVYFFRKDGRVFCVDLKTGEELYYERTHTSQHRSTPIVVDGHLIFCAKDGFCTVLKTGRKFEIVAENEMSEPITASPVVSNGVLYLRTYEALYAIKAEK
ncbi:outer membrane protein assembly factor BamB family protein [Thalassoglobus polymorphus]|uniref:Outer membrane biogenesis protein BamB n=1 Tax=Thalassoglobus polymorphus TaxID=2527994 RepID=A0A517QP22_9PLAN|nr:PQQ-binding-like beta-propeller repeat protein [Thalassoglobus polymorphus]QDT33365.1 outer membrane biogenesis protein BamB [Thalassoglobus polymorphus]